MVSVNLLLKEQSRINFFELKDYCLADKIKKILKKQQKKLIWLKKPKRKYT